MFKIKRNKRDIVTTNEIQTFQNHLNVFVIILIITLFVMSIILYALFISHQRLIQHHFLLMRTIKNCITYECVNIVVNSFEKK